jgi:hypothetical protein
MFKSHLISGLLAGVALLGVCSYVDASGPCGDSCGDSCAAPCAPAMRTVLVKEWFPENYETTRTTYKTEYVTETYTAYRTECVPETRTYTTNVTRMVPVTKDVEVTTYKCVPSVEMRTVTKKVPVCREVTTVTRKCVDQGHWECVQVECKPGLLERLHHKDCCCEPCPKYKTKKVWVPCKVWVETPCTKTVRTFECVTEQVAVTVNHTVPVKEIRKVCSYTCVSEPVVKTCTVNVSRCVPYQATRCVAKCVPVVEKVTACRMVCRMVEKQVPACEASCCSGGHKHSFFHRKSSCCD